MPEIAFDEACELLKLLDFHSLHDEKQAKIDADNYINNTITLDKLTPSGIYFVIKKLEGLKQSEFIKNNIERILQDDEDIFIYNMMAPKSLPHFLNYTSLKTIYEFAPTIFDKILEDSFTGIIEKLTKEELICFFKEFKDKLNCLENTKFISNIAMLRYKSPRDRSIIDVVLDLYKDKISNLQGHDLLKYFEFIIDSNKAYEYIENNKDRFISAIKETDPGLLHFFLLELDCNNKKTALLNLAATSIDNNFLNKVIESCSLDSVLFLYKKDPSLFKRIKLESIVKSGNKDFAFKQEDLKELLDTYPLESIEMLHTILTRSYFSHSINPVAKYLEEKFRSNIEINGKLSRINEKTNVYSNEYLKNLKEIQALNLDNTSKIYQDHLRIFIRYLIDRDVIDIPNNDEVKQLDIYFHRILKGESLVRLIALNSIQDIAMLNRHRAIEFDAEELSVNQIASYNIKEHKQLYSSYMGEPFYQREYKLLTLKLMLMLGYKGASYVLSIDNSLPTLEHLVGNVDVSEINLDNNHNPILNKRFINIMFNDKDNPRIKEMLNDKTSLLYKYFPRMFNEWSVIRINHKDNNLASIFEFLEGEDIHLPPRYYKLEKELKYVGCKSNIVNEAMALHDAMLDRYTSSIPRVKGSVDEYTYEVIRYDDLEGISVGNKTNCCFTIKGRAFTCLKHALASSNGRILIVKKNEELVAHSWLWRNGNLLCIDNIEVNKGVTTPEFFACYKDFVNNIVTESNIKEGSEAIHTVTLGKSTFDFRIPELSDYKNMRIITFPKEENEDSIIVESLPQPIEYVSYSDSNKKQYILYGDMDYSLYAPNTIYEDERLETYVYKKSDDTNKETKEKIEKHLNYLRHLKEKDNPNFTISDLHNIEILYINSDYYIAINKKGEIESYLIQNDPRANVEYNNILISINKKVKSV